MSSDSDASSSGSTAAKRSRKAHKKHKRSSEKKHKKEKKEKRHKREKRAKRHDASSGEEEEAPAKVVKVQQSVAPASSVLMEPEVDAFGPALPPHLQQRVQVVEETQRIIGPIIPNDLKAATETEREVTQSETANAAPSSNSDASDTEDLAGTFGPLPVTGGEMSATQVELEQRALELKLAAIAGNSMKDVDQAEREEWMLELPEVGLKSGLAALANMKRTFHQGKERPDFSDRSSWTKTPQSEANPQKASSSKTAAEDLRSTAQATYERTRDAEQESLAKKHKKKHKRDESLVELHQKKLRKEQRKKEKELAAAGAKPERRPFSRDVDLKLNKIDKNQTKQIVDKAKILNTKFSSGHTKYL